MFLAIVTDHGDAVNVTDMIEKNVEDVAVNVDEGNRQLEKGVTYKVCGKCYLSVKLTSWKYNISLSN